MPKNNKVNERSSRHVCVTYNQHVAFSMSESHYNATSHIAMFHWKTDEHAMNQCAEQSGRLVNMSPRHHFHTD